VPDETRRGLTDSHAHLSYVIERNGEAFLGEIAAAYSGGSGIIVDPGVEHDDFPKRKAAFGGLPFVRLTAGIWPDAESMKAVTERIAVLEGYARDEACVAIGECGLDYHWMNGTEAEQEALFRAQAELAVRYDKPLIVHSREARDDTLAIVSDFAPRIPVIIHCFGYDEDAARAFLSLGCWISFAGNMTYKRSDGLRAACAVVPEDRLLLETDAPYMCPEPRRGKDSSPLDIERTYTLAATLRGTSVERLGELVRRNAGSVFEKGRSS
jgi:TatD DNase family protein